MWTSPTSSSSYVEWANLRLWTQSEEGAHYWRPMFYGYRLHPEPRFWNNGAVAGL